MSLYTVHRRDGDAADKAVFVRDGFCWSAFVLGVVWALWNRMWLVAAALFLAAALITAAGVALHLSPIVQALANLAVALIFGFEARGLQRWSLGLAGWRQVGLVAGATEEQAELDYFSGIAPDVPLPGPWRAGPAADHDPLGLFGRA